MDAAAHYRHLLTLGRDEFLASAAPAVLVRYRLRTPDLSVTGTNTLTVDQSGHETVDVAMTDGKLPLEAAEMELFPLAKKLGASFRDRITIGRTENNDVVIADPSVSRLHAYVRHANGWVVADAGSKNGTWLGDEHLEPRREVALPTGAVIRFGDVHLIFYRSSELFELLGGDHGRR
jgi:pSer/pThr/pTyr-binding forkhead associated (FHA) protein